MEIPHNIPIGSLVEVKYNEWGSDGSCQKVHARLWVVKHTRDCDGTPLYSLCLNPIHKDIDVPKIHVVYINAIGDNRDFVVPNDISFNMVKNIKSGFAEHSLTVIEITKDIKSGKNCLEWSE